MIDFKKTITNDGIAIVKVDGWLKDFACPYFFGCMEDLIKDGHHEIVIDCSELELISSSCLNSLIRARGRAKKHNGSIVLANVNSTTSEVIGFLGLSRLIGIFPSVDEALLKIRRKLQKTSRNKILHPV